MRTSVNRIKRDIETLATFTATPGQGVTRFSFTEQDRKARDYIKNEMIRSGLSVREDAAGSVIGRRAGNNPSGKVVMIGSHFDTVRNGGAFDGCAGVVAAIETARVIHDQNIITDSPIEVVAMVEEEGARFGSSLFGSRAMTGKITCKDLDAYKDDDGITLRQAMEQFGVKPELNKAKRSKSSVKAFIELHIEQGPVLESKAVNIGVVESIVGLCEYSITIKGRSGHAGTTPMHLRSDALLAASHVVIAANSAAKIIGEGIVATVGKLKVMPGSVNVIPDVVELNIDIRSQKQDNIKRVLDSVVNVLDNLKAEIGIMFEVSKVFEAEPVKLSPFVTELIKEKSRALGFSSVIMNSGAGHDAMAMADFTETGMIFVPSKDGKSHRPDEWTDYEALQKGAETLLEVVLALAK